LHQEGAAGQSGERIMSSKQLALRVLSVGGAMAVLIVAGGAAWRASGTAAHSTGDPYADLPATMTLTGVCRDFKWAAQSGGHVDFEYVPTSGYAHYVGSVADTLDSDGKPVFASAGYKVSTEATDASGRNIMTIAKSYISSRSGDHAGVKASSTGGSLHTASAFSQWYRDVAGVNLSKLIPITLVRQPNSNLYSFSDKTDAAYSNKGGFFPIDGDLYGNPSGQSHNFGFTYELSTNFVYKSGSGQVFTFTGDDDVWVFIDGKLVVDIGGVHSAVSQTIDLDRLNWLVDGHKYSFKLFFAERHTTQSNVRIDTNLNLQNVELPPSTGLFD
jgi:fibro-slime domain-containing protein